jgi:HlyD family secretion protein
MIESNFFNYRKIFMDSGKKKSGVLFWMGITLALIGLCMVIWAIVAPKWLLKTFGWKDENEVGTLKVRKLFPCVIKKVITVKGRVQSYQEITITSQVSGEIRRIAFKEGDLVKKGDLLVEIDPKTLGEELVATKSRLEQAKLSLAILKIRGNEYQEKLERSKRLFQQGLTSAEESQSLRYATSINKTDMERAVWQIKEMEGEVASIEKRLGQTKICSPMDGVVTKLIVKEGEGVIQGLVNTSGTAIMKISDMAQKGVTVWISEADVPFLKVGQTVAITCPNFRGQLFKAYLLQIAMTGQAEQQTDLTKFEVKTRFSEPYPDLFLEMSAVVSIEVGSKTNVLSVPLASIQTEEKREEEKNKGDKRRRNHDRPEDNISNISYQDFVFVVEEGKLAKRYITTGLTNEKEAEVVKGLLQDQLVVVGPPKSFAKLEVDKKVKWEDEETQKSQVASHRLP